MGSRLRGLTVLVVVLAVGAFLGSALGQWMGEAPAAGPAAAGPPPGERVRVEVLNGGGRNGMAARATDRLRGLGFDVVYYGNRSGWDEEPSVVLDRIGDVAGARSVADALGIPRVRSEPDSNLYLDVSVVLGREWEPRVDTVAPQAEPAWWDLRRFFDDDPAPGPTVPGGRLVDPGEGGG